MALQPTGSSYSDYPDQQQQQQQKSLDEPNLHDDPPMASVSDRYFDGDNGGTKNGGDGKPVYSKLWFWFLVAGVVLVLGVVGTTVGLIRPGKKDDDGGAVGVRLPAPELDADAVNANRNELGELLLTMYTERDMDWAPVGALDTPQGRALTFVAGAASYGQLSRARNIERYALVVFYLHTYRQPHALETVVSTWSSDQNWLSKESVCVWEGVVCDDDDSVREILLPNHDLSGSLPAELSLLLNLETIDLTTNFIYMEGEHHFLWSIMPNLLELTMDDNFVIAENGLPAEFVGLRSIEKISLSYNLLQGSFDGALFDELGTTLQHLELESNYIEGPLPPQLLAMPSLVYLYVRRNALVIDLDEMFTQGNLPSIFALWLDDNEIGGTIPPTIGLYTDLASLSVTEAALTGPLPTQMGELVNMRRCWLYDNALTGPIPRELDNWGQLQVLELYGNDLTGDMPMAVCDAVDASDYEFRTLAADCEKVSCENCCTECF